MTSDFFEADIVATPRPDLGEGAVLVRARPPRPKSRMVSATEAARMLGYSSTSPIYEMVKAGEIPRYQRPRARGRFRFFREDIEALAAVKGA